METGNADVAALIVALRKIIIDVYTAKRLELEMRLEDANIAEHKAIHEQIFAVQQEIDALRIDHRIIDALRSEVEALKAHIVGNADVALRVESGER